MTKLKAVDEYPVEIQKTVVKLRKVQAAIDGREKENDVLRRQRDQELDLLIAGGMGPKEAMGIVGLSRNAYYRRVEKAS